MIQPKRDRGPGCEHRSNETSPVFSLFSYSRVLRTNFKCSAFQGNSLPHSSFCQTEQATKDSGSLVETKRQTQKNKLQ